MTPKAQKVTATTVLISIPAAIAAALFVGGTHTAPPPSIPTPTAGALYSRYVVQEFDWTPSTDATGYRLYLDGTIIGLTPANRTGTLLSMTCGVQHRFNSQPFNNKGFAVLAKPVYVTPPCDKATT